MTQTSIVTQNGKALRLVASPARHSGLVAAPAATARLRLWTILLFTATALLIVACVACYVFLRHQIDRNSAPASLAPAIAPVLEPLPPLETAHTTAKPPVPVASAKAGPPPIPAKASVLPPPSVAIAPPSKVAASAPPPADAKVAMQRDRLLESVGSLGAVQLYQCYLNVGLLADAVEHETYNKTEAAEVLGTINLLAETARTQMEKLETIDLDADDIQALKQSREVARLIKTQSDHLREHWAAGDKAAIERYHETRKQSWSELAKILGVSK